LCGGIYPDYYDHNSTFIALFKTGPPSELKQTWFSDTQEYKSWTNGASYMRGTLGEERSNFTIGIEELNQQGTGFRPGSTIP
jgi:hypothetical protein